MTVWSGVYRHVRNSLLLVLPLKKGCIRSQQTEKIPGDNDEEQLTLIYDSDNNAGSCGQFRLAERKTALRYGFPENG